MPAGALVGLKKMLTSPFGPAVFVALAMGAVMWYMHTSNERLQSRLDEVGASAASCSAARSIDESEKSRLRENIKGIKSDLEKAEQRRRVVEKRANQAAREALVFDFPENIENGEKVNAEEMTKWYQDL